MSQIAGSDVATDHTAGTTVDSKEPPSTFRRIAPALALFFLSPLVAEFLLGNMSIAALPALIFVAPLYGGGAVVIREVARRAGRGWPTIILLALAYWIFEEGLLMQSLFSPTFFGIDLIGYAHIPVLGMGAWWTLFVLTLHTVWSISVPIALVEAFVPDRATTPWLGRIGLPVAAVVFLAGSVMSFSGVYNHEHFLAAPAQLIGAAAAVVLLVAASFFFGGRPSVVSTRPAPSPWTVGLASLAASSLFMLGTLLPTWWTVGIWLALSAGFAVLVTRWSRRAEWNGRYRLALAGGALMTYAWHGFPQPPLLGASGTVDLVGNALFALGAVALLLAAGRRMKRRPRAPS